MLERVSSEVIITHPPITMEHLHMNHKFVKFSIYFWRNIRILLLSQQQNI